MLLRSVAFALTFSTAIAACQNAKDPPAPPHTTAAPSPASPEALPSGLTRVANPAEVCMVNNTYMGKPQIPIEVDGRTYYGCCAMCKDRLGNEPGTRTALDPLTGETVDKATAVIAQDKGGAVVYFASEDNLRRYRPPQ